MSVPRSLYSCLAFEKMVRVQPSAPAAQWPVPAPVPAISPPSHVSQRCELEMRTRTTSMRSIGSEPSGATHCDATPGTATPACTCKSFVNTQAKPTDACALGLYLKLHATCFAPGGAGRGQGAKQRRQLVQLSTRIHNPPAQPSAMPLAAFPATLCLSALIREFGPRPSGCWLSMA